MVSLGAIVEGYSIVVSKEHHSCCAALPAALGAEFEAAISAVAGAQLELYGSSTYYEHGRTGTCLPGGEGEHHCFHAHLHVVPTTAEVSTELAALYGGEIYATWDEVRGAYVESPLPYLLSRDPGGIRVCPDVGNVRRQLLRSLVATHAGEPHLADWEAFPRHTVIDAGIERLAAPVQARLDSVASS